MADDTLPSSDPTTEAFDAVLQHLVELQRLEINLRYQLADALQLAEQLLREVEQLP